MELLHINDITRSVDNKELLIKHNDLPEQVKYSKLEVIQSLSFDEAKAIILSNDCHIDHHALDCVADAYTVGFMRGTEESLRKKIREHFNAMNK